MNDHYGRIRVGKLPAAAGALALAFVIAIWTLNPVGLPGLARERAFDLLYTLFPRSSGNTPVVAVDIDDKTLQALGDWPIPRAEIARLVEWVAAAGAAAIALDIFFSGPDCRSSHTLADEVSRLSGGERYAAAIRELPDSDAAFAAILARTPAVIGVLAAPSPEPAAFNLIRVDGTLGPDEVTRAGGFTPPYGVLADAALAIGIQSLFGEDGARVRRVPLLIAGSNVLAPGLALETARVATGAAIVTVSSKDAKLIFGDRSADIAEGSQMRIHWTAPTRWPLRTISALDVLQGKAEAGRFSGAAVVIGSSTPQAGALRPTAVNPLTPSLQIEAEAIEQLIAGGASVRRYLAYPLEIAAMLLIGLAAAAVAALLGPLPAAAGVAALIAAWIATSVGAFIAGSLIDPVGPTVAAVLAGNVAAGVSFARSLRLKALISRRFAQYLAPDVVAEIIARPDRLKRSGEMRTITALFTDVEGFTEMTNRLAPTELIALLDQYFDVLCRTALNHNGMIDAIAGDALHIFFNVPLERHDHVDVALDCAVEIFRVTEEFRRTSAARAARFGRTRIGIESGPAIVGDVGGSRRLNYTAHGDAINMAARLEAANKEFGSAICVGPGAAAAARRTKLHALGALTLRGFDAPVSVFTPEGLSSPTPERP
jgi:adenylate cyclase